jgi:dGTPase
LAKRPSKTTSRTPNAERRFYPEKAADGRSSAQRDRDRILYAGAFARLAEITQVISPERGYVFHNRLTHSLKVGQIARRLAEHLIRAQPKEAEAYQLDPDAAEAAGLAHDLGHPPFGHIAEEELNSLVRKEGVHDGYEGNAQAFRILTRLATSDALDSKDSPIEGLNLTRMTLDGVLKYPWAAGDRANPRKWGYYRTEQDIFDWVRTRRRKRQRSVIAEIMDWADDITFAIHDLLDFYCAGKIPIDRCKRPGSAERERLIEGMFERKPKWKSERARYIEALDAILEQFPFEPEQRYKDTGEDRAKLYTFSTGLIRHFVSSFRLQSPRSAQSVRIDSYARCEVEVLKQFIWEYVIENPDLAVPQNGQRAAVRGVFTELLTASKDKKYFLFPSGFHNTISKAKTKRERVRTVADCVAGMTEKELMHFHRSLHGLGV